MELERLRASALNGSTNALEELHALAEKNTITFPAVWPVIAKLIEPYGLSELKRRKACSTSEPRIQQILACLNLLSALLIHPDGLVKLHPPIPLDARVTLWKCLEPWVAFLAQATVNAKPTLLNHAGSAFVDAVILPLEAFFLAVAQHPDCLGTQAWDLERRIKFSAPLCVIWRRCMASDHLYRPYALSRALSRLFWVGIQSPHTLASIAFDVNNPTEGESAMLHHAERFGVNEEGECSWPSVHSFLQLLAVFETTYGSVWLERRAEQVRALTIMLRVFGSRRAKMVLNAGPSGRSLLAVHGIMEKIFVSLNLRSGGTVYEALKAEILVSLANLHYQTQSIRPAPGEEAECWRDVRSTAAETLKTIKPMLFWPSMRSLALTYIKAIEAGGVENKLEKTTEYWKEWQAFKKVADELKEGDGAIRQVFHSCSYHECPTPKPIPKPVKSCTGCHQAGYCSSECQRADWRKIHSKMCKRLIVNTNDKMYSKPDAVYLLRRAALDYHARKEEISRLYKDFDAKRVYAKFKAPPPIAPYRTSPADAPPTYDLDDLLYNEKDPERQKHNPPATMHGVPVLLMDYRDYAARYDGHFSHLTKGGVTENVRTEAGLRELQHSLETLKLNEGKHEPKIEMRTIDTCQDVLVGQHTVDPRTTPYVEEAIIVVGPNGIPENGEGPAILVTSEEQLRGTLGLVRMAIGTGGDY